MDTRKSELAPHPVIRLESQKLIRFFLFFLFHPEFDMLFEINTCLFQQKTENETCILRVVESYNTATRQKLIPRQTMLIRYNSLENPIEEGNYPILHKIETQINNLNTEVSRLKNELEFERNERKKLEIALANNSTHPKRSPL